MRTSSRQSGLTLIELIVFIVIVGIAVAGVMALYGTVVRGSADPMARKQALSIAESMLLEIEQQGFSWCDPQDANASTATSGAGCAVAANDQTSLGPKPASSSRGGTVANTTPFNNVGDYAGYTQTPATDILGNNAVPGYTVSVAITAAGGAAPFADLTAEAMLRIAVTVAGNGETVTLVGYRARYAPNAAG